jgi:quercetin dioxygenase-like cupin family protein
MLSDSPGPTGGAQPSAPTPDPPARSVAEPSLESLGGYGFPSALWRPPARHPPPGRRAIRWNSSLRGVPATKSATARLTALTVRGVTILAAGIAALGRSRSSSHHGPRQRSGTAFQSTVLWQTSADGTDYVLLEITIAPGGSTGWHWHDGRLYGVIKQGTLTHNMSDCSNDGTYYAGDSIAEPSGADHVHIGRNLGSTPLVIQVLYIDPAGSPPSEDAPDPGCGYA